MGIYPDNNGIYPAYLLDRFGLVLVCGRAEKIVGYGIWKEIYLKG